MPLPSLTQNPLRNMNHESPFITFRKFNNKNLALELGSFLEENKIDFELEDNSPRLDASFGGGELSKEYSVMIKKVDFQQANHLLLESSVNDFEDIDKDYYLFTFTDEELLDIIVRSDEWSKFDFMLAQKLLTERGKEISRAEVEKLQIDRLNELAKPERTQSAAIFAGYFFALMGGVLGIITGWYLSTNKKTLPNGETVYVYSASDRRHGKRIVLLGIICLGLWIIVRVFGPLFYTSNNGGL
jgi:hypothetical protein